MKLFLKTATTAVLSCFLLSGAFAQQKLNATDVEEIIKEMEAYIPRNPGYLYPIKMTLNPSDTINAYVTVERTPERKFQSLMVVFQGLIDFLDNDKDLLRAVIAHEMAHLSKGHPTDTATRRRGADLGTIYTRQLEYEADRLGAQALVSAGHSKMDMVKVLVRLSELSDKSGNIALHMTGTHADGRMRAAQISNDDSILLAAIEYKSAVGFLQARQYGIAAELFGVAYAKDSRLKEALIMQGQASLMNYYDQLPDAVKNQMFKPDFGPILPIPVTPRGDTITAEDRQRYNEALALLRRAVSEAPKSAKASELLGLALALNPDNNKANTASGLKILQEISKTVKEPEDVLRLANNVGLALARQGDEKKGTEVIREAFVATTATRSFNMEAAENMVRQPLPKLSQRQALRFEAIIRTYLIYGVAADSAYKSAMSAYEELCKAAGLKPQSIENKADIAQIVTMKVGGKDLRLLGDEKQYEGVLGKPATKFVFTDRYPDIFEQRYRGGDVVTIFESGKAFRITSYVPGSSVEIRARSATSAFRVTVSVGMKASTLGIDLKGFERVKLVRGTETEVWTYLPGLNVAVFSKDGNTIDGISVLPAL